MIDFQFSDLHCHPTLKPFGASFSRFNKENGHSSLWYRKQPKFITKCIQKLSGATRFSQADLVTLINGNVKVAFVSLYPFEKGFFTNPYLNDKLVALFSSVVTSIGYNRVRYLQKHTDYYLDLMNEYEFLLQTPKKYVLNNITYSFEVLKSSNKLKAGLNQNNHLLIIPTIEGAHVFNSGLADFGVSFKEENVISNIKRIKKFSNPPFFITFAHNFNNDLCGHAPSLECLGSLVNQTHKLNTGFTNLGVKVLHHLLSKENGKPIYIDVKHMSLKSRLQYYNILKTDYSNSIPIIVSHGAVTGRDTCGNITTSLDTSLFANDSINFYDDEIVIIAKSNGIFALQLDSKRLGTKQVIKKSIFSNNVSKNLRASALIVWRQLQHIAEVLDAKGLFAWGTSCIGSDFDGTINPLDEVWTASNLNAFANELVVIAEAYLSNPNALIQERNKNISAIELVRNFTIQNTLNFIKTYYLSQNPILV